MKYKNVSELVESKRWSTKGPTIFDNAANYCGSNLSEYVVVGGTNRDADTLTSSNFESMLELLGGENEDAGIMVGHFGHWACGWYELILIRDDNKSALSIALKALNKLDDYPVLDDDHFSQLENDELQETLEANLNSFRNEVMEFLDFDFQPRGEKLKALDEFISEVLFEDASYRGHDYAWVCKKSIERASATGNYPNMPENLFYKLCNRKAN